MKAVKSCQIKQMIKQILGSQCTENEEESEL